MQKSVIIDTDPAIGLPFRDIDDGLAIIFLLAAGIEIIGLTINFGNTKMEKAYKIANDLLNILQRNDIKILKGASTSQDLGKESEAVKFLLEEVNSKPGKITILAIAPLTNIASAIKIDSKFLSKVKELIIMGGTLKYRLGFPFGEYNFCCDPSSANIVLNSPYYKTVITLDLCLQALFTPNHYLQIKRKNSPICKYIKNKIKFWLIINSLYFFRLGFYPWDIVASAYITNPEIFENKYTYLFSDKHKLKRGYITESEKHNSILTNVPNKIDNEKFSQIMIKYLTKL